MKNKKLIFKTLILLLFVSYYKSSKIFSQKKESTLKDYNLEKYLTKSKTNSLNKIINDFDVYLKDSYLEISSEERMYEFTNDLLESYKFYNQNVTESNHNTLFKGQKILNNISFFYPLIINLKETKLLDDILTKNDNTLEQSDTINTWINSILLKKGIEISDNQHLLSKIDSIENIKSKKKHRTKYVYNCKSVYYYALYRSLKPTDNLIREYIEDIVSYDCMGFPPQDYLQRFLKTIQKKGFDKPLLKILIFTEFYMPLILIEYENR